jgi:peroxiredoxin
MPLNVGDPMPQLELQQGGRTYRAQPGSKGQLLYFMRASDCALCRAHVKRLIALAPQLEAKGLSILVVLPPGDSETQVMHTLKPPFPVAQGLAAHAAVGLQRKFMSLVQQSGTVIHDHAGVVVHSRAATIPSNAFDEDAVLEFVA